LPFCTVVTSGKGDYQIEYEPAPRITEADKTNDKKYEIDKWLLFLPILT
jgi:hypothetical protein